MTRPRHLDWIKLDITILSTIVLLSVFFTGLVFLVCQSEFCPGLWIKSRVLVNYCTIRAIVKIKMVLKVVFGTSLPIVNRRVRCTKREESGMQRSGSVIGLILLILCAWFWESVGVTCRSGLREDCGQCADGNTVPYPASLAASPLQLGARRLPPLSAYSENCFGSCRSGMAAEPSVSADRTYATSS